MKKDIHNKLIQFGSVNLSDWTLLEVLGDLSKIEEFLQGQGDSIVSYDMGPYGEYIRATAKVSVWSELLNAEFRVFQVTYDEFENELGVRVWAQIQIRIRTRTTRTRTGACASCHSTPPPSPSSVL